MKALTLHLWLLALLVANVVRGDHGRDVQFVTQPRQPRMAQVVHAWALFPRGAPYDEVTVRTPTGEVVVLDAHLPQWAWLPPRPVGTLLRVNCLRDHAAHCRPPGFYDAGWWVVQAYGLLLLALLALPLHHPRVRGGRTR